MRLEKNQVPIIRDSTPFLLRAFNAIELVFELVLDEYWAGRADATLVIDQAIGFALEAEQQFSLLRRAV